MNLVTNDTFIEECADIYFNQPTKNGTPIYQIYTFEQFLNMQAKGVGV